ncbi:MAG: SDR family NAD(P)-dependent oxidoreductase [Acetobacteraceae bacterium]|nr:SDR family NAD(P)-dependent oxidoreductase [Acetobacteraceae bacterium]
MKIAVVAGATRGIGAALVEQLARLWGDGGMVYLTARREADGAAQVARLAGQGVRVGWLPFDLADPASARHLAATLRGRHGGVDVAVLNGAFVPGNPPSDAAEAAQMIATNNHGTLRFLEAFGPLLRDHGRLVVVASGFGVLANLPPQLRARFDTRLNGPAAIDAAMDGYVAALAAGTAVAEGWPDWANIPSKVGQVAVTRAYARRHGTDRGVLINAACPGLTATDATRHLMDTVFKGREAQTPEQAARDLVWLCTLPPGMAQPHGELVRHRAVLPFGD